jgi:predicted DNA binding CopG/RHH family protein
MTTEPYVNVYLDDEERELIKAIEADDYKVGESFLTQDFLSSLQQAAKNTVREASTEVSIRFAQTDLARVKALAFREGIPYQTLIKSIVHKAINY